MDFECNFNNVNFCQYSSKGWGFQKSIIMATDKLMQYKNQLKRVTSSSQKSMITLNTNYFPCADASENDNVPFLSKLLPSNLTSGLCLKMFYLLDENGNIEVKNGRSKWSKSIDSASSSSPWHWATIPIPINPIGSSMSSDFGSHLEILGRGVCVDNLTLVAPSHCSMTTAQILDSAAGNVGGSGNGGSGLGNGDGGLLPSSGLLLAGPLSLLVAIIAVVTLLLCVGLVTSLACVRRADSTHHGSHHSKSLSGNHRRRYRHCNGGGSYLDAGTQQRTLDSCCLDSEAAVLSGNGGGRLLCHNCALPALVNVRSNPHIAPPHNPRSCYYYPSPLSRGSAAVATAVANEARFSLALTEDAQLQLLSNQQQTRQLSSSGSAVARQPSFSSTVVHELSPSPTPTAVAAANITSELCCCHDVVLSNPAGSVCHDDGGRQGWIETAPARRPSASLLPTPIVPVTRDTSRVSTPVSEPPAVMETQQQRTRPIRESLNIGYVSDSSLCDLPHYEAALELLMTSGTSAGDQAQEDDYEEADDEDVLAVLDTCTTTPVGSMDCQQ